VRPGGPIPAAPEPGAGLPARLGSLYAALAGGRIDTEQLRDLLASSLPPADPLVFAVDVTTWPRCDAECSPQRGYYYHPSRHSAGQPIIAGWAYQWIAGLGFARDSWTAPVDATRLHPTHDTDQVAAGQIRALLERLPVAGNQPPLFVFDGGYDFAQLTLDLADLPVAVLVRLRSDRCFSADPPPRPPGATGRPRRHGAKFNCADPTTWPVPTATLHTVDDQYGTVTVQAWSGLHPKQQHPSHGTGKPRPIARGTIIRVQVQRVPARTRPPKVLWLSWAGPTSVALDLDLAWHAYIRKFDLEHTVRFAKQTLGWATPRPRHPEQADRWTWLMLAAHTQLRLAQAVTADARLPWQRPRPAGSPLAGSAAGFRNFWPRSARRLPRQNPQGAPQAGPRAAAPGPQRATPAIKKTNKQAKKAA
jgi:hypothetical protein